VTVNVFNLSKSEPKPIVIWYTMGFLDMNIEVSVPDDLDH
jgi:hypothetical protein